MDFSSKDYDRIRVSRRKAAGGGGRAMSGGDQATISRACDVEGCKEAADYRAPMGRGKEGQFHHFCLEHVREYNKSYNYFEGMTDDDVIAYQRDALTGHRPTKPIGVRGGPPAPQRPLSLAFTTIRSAFLPAGDRTSRRSKSRRDRSRGRTATPSISWVWSMVRRGRRLRRGTKPL